MYRYGLLIFLLNFGYDVSASTSKSINELLDLGTNSLSKRQYQDALQYFHEAAEKDPDNYLIYYKRGAAYLAIGKTKQALVDFDIVLEYKPDLTLVRSQRGNIHLKSGNFDKAEEDFNNLVSESSNKEEALDALQKINYAKDQIQLAEYKVEQGDFQVAISILTELIDICPWSPYFRKLRAECYIRSGDPATAVFDIRWAAKFMSDNTEDYYKLATVLYELGNIDESLDEIRNCLKLDPEHKDGYPFYKKIKKISKLIKDAGEALEKSNNNDCIKKANSVLKQETSIDNIRFHALRLLCKAHTANSEVDTAIKHCRDALKIQKDVDTLCDGAEAYLEADMFDDAIMNYKEALKIDSDNQRAKQGLQRAEQRQKQSESRDYYKILNVPRNAKKKQIIKAYRKAAQQWHPDNFPDPDEKKRAEKKFIDIAAAKEVLTDDQKRAEFDAGRDPLDPESGKHQHGFNPFQEFHHFQSGGSPFHFKFHFN